MTTASEIADRLATDHKLTNAQGNALIDCVSRRSLKQVQ